MVHVVDADNARHLLAPPFADRGIDVPLPGRTHRSSSTLGAHGWRTTSPRERPRLSHPSRHDGVGPHCRPTSSLRSPPTPNQRPGRQPVPQQTLLAFSPSSCESRAAYRPEVCGSPGRDGWLQLCPPRPACASHQRGPTFRRPLADCASWPLRQLPTLSFDGLHMYHILITLYSGPLVGRVVFRLRLILVALGLLPLSASPRRAAFRRARLA